MGAGIQSSGRRKSGRRTRRQMSEINVTPFVDVMLVLLIIFMVAAPLMTTGVTVDLPSSQASALSKESKDPVEVSINADAQIFVGEKQLSANQLLPFIQSLTEGDGDTRIYIRADRGLAYGDVMKVMAELNRSGFRKVALISQPK